MLRKAVTEDLDSIVDMMKQVIPLMQAAGNPQWSREYPARADFQKDIQAETLYVWEQEGRILGVVCVNFEEPEGYKTVAWSREQKATIVHRMAVAPEGRGRGIGTAMFLLAERIASENGTGYLRTDTYGTNQEMNGLMEKMGYRLMGQCTFPGRNGNFNCYEKAVSSV